MPMIRLATLRRALLALVLGVVLACGAKPPPATAQQPTAANSDAVLLNYLRGEVSGRVSIPDEKSGKLIQPQGREFRAFHDDTLKTIGAVSVLGVLGLLVVFYMVRGRIPIEGGPSGRFVLRFKTVERFAHWLTASTFIVLGLTGLNLVFGKTLLLPIIGPEAFTALSQWGKYAHNYLSFPFVLGIVLMLLFWVKDNIPAARDIAWLKAGGGIVGHGHVEAKKFNAGQKLIFWSVILGGTAIAVSGFVMMFPFYWTDVHGQQLAVIVHGIVGLVLVAIILAHIYIGSVGMEGAYDAMGTGLVDYNWAKAHHSLWLEEQAGKGRGASVPAGGAKAGAD
ncbi:MAG: formate dehydrogenase subunit gamma [Rhodospirillales bacterium]|jgi:formate dehydrogenase subunit gamma